MDYRVGDPPGVQPIEPAHSVTQVDRDALSDACCHAQHLLFARRARKAPTLEPLERSHPVDEPHWHTGRTVEDLDRFADEVASRQPHLVIYQQLDGRLSAEHPPRVLLKRRREILEVGSK